VDPLYSLSLSVSEYFFLCAPDRPLVAAGVRVYGLPPRFKCFFVSSKNAHYVLYRDVIAMRYSESCLCRHFSLSLYLFLYVVNVNAVLYLLFVTESGSLPAVCSFVEGIMDHFHCGQARSHSFASEAFNGVILIKNVLYLSIWF